MRPRLDARPATVSVSGVMGPHGDQALTIAAREPLGDQRFVPVTPPNSPVGVVVLGPIGPVESTAVDWGGDRGTAGPAARDHRAPYPRRPTAYGQRDTGFPFPATRTRPSVDDLRFPSPADPGAVRPSSNARRLAAVLGHGGPGVRDLRDRPARGPGADGCLELRSVQLVVGEAARRPSRTSHRAAAGLRALRVDSTLTSIARSRSKDMIVRNYFSHSIPPSGKQRLLDPRLEGLLLRDRRREHRLEQRTRTIRRRRPSTTCS